MCQGSSSRVQHVGLQDRWRNRLRKSAMESRPVAMPIQWNGAAAGGGGRSGVRKLLHPSAVVWVMMTIHYLLLGAVWCWWPRWKVLPLSLKGGWHKRLQMYQTNVLFAAPDQGQMLDVWESQTAESALRCMCHSTRRGHHLSLGLISWIPQDTPIGIRADILDHTYWNQGKIQFNDCPVRRNSYSTWLCSELVRYATSVLWA